MQALAEPQDTEKSELFAAPVGTGVGRIRQLAPFHRSASGTPTSDELAALPTAVHARGPRHDTETSSLPRLRAGSGVGMTRQRIPSHRSASDTVLPRVLVRAPTAMHARAELQVTPKKPVAASPAGLIAAWIAHLLPFHRSTRVRTRPARLK